MVKKCKKGYILMWDKTTGYRGRSVWQSSVGIFTSKRKAEKEAKKRKLIKADYDIFETAKCYKPMPALKPIRKKRKSVYQFKTHKQLLGSFFGRKFT